MTEKGERPLDGAQDDRPDVGEEPTPARYTTSGSGVQDPDHLAEAAPELARPVAEAAPAPEAADSREGAEDDDEERYETPLSTKIRTIVVSVIVFLVFAAIAVPIYSTLQPEYYSRYPQLRVRMQNWAKSTHSKIGCAGCHVDPGPIGFMGFAAKAIPDFYMQLIVGPRSTNLLSAPDREACQKCHTNYRQISPDGDLLIPHRAHVVVLGIQCAFCHRNLVHSLNTEGFNKPEMTTCLICHNGGKATNLCVKCHTQKQVPPSHKQADWLVIHSKMTKTIDCSKCHGWSPDFCKQCHSKKPASHVGNWKTLHAAVARPNPKRCHTCHTNDFCKRCHDKAPGA